MITSQPYRTSELPAEGSNGAAVSKQNQVRQYYAESKTRMIRKLLALGYQMGYDKPNNATELKMKQWEVNKKHINAWLLSDHSAVRKEMDEMTHKELTIVVTQFTKVYNDFLKRL